MNAGSAKTDPHASHREMIPHWYINLADVAPDAQQPRIRWTISSNEDGCGSAMETRLEVSRLDKLVLQSTNLNMPSHPPEQHNRTTPSL